MPQATLTVRLNESLSEFVASNVSDQGAYDNVSEYIRDLIRRDKAQTEALAFERLKAELQHAFSAPETDYVQVTAKEVIRRNRDNPTP